MPDSGQSGETMLPSVGAFTLPGRSGLFVVDEGRSATKRQDAPEFRSIHPSFLQKSDTNDPATIKSLRIS